MVLLLQLLTLFINNLPESLWIWKTINIWIPMKTHLSLSYLFSNL